MKVVFISNYFNHHQKPFCEAMNKRLGDDFTFIATGTMGEERKKLGYVQDKAPPYVLSISGDAFRWNVARALVLTADVAIAGACPDKLLYDRLLAEKLVLRYSERPFKKKTSLPRRAYHAIRFRKSNQKSRNVYMLCASAYTAKDFASVGMYKKRTYKWGYFPAVMEYDPDSLMAQKKTSTLMWCGRFIDWKHPDDAVKLAHKLKENGYDFQLNFVGTGAMEAELHQMVATLGLSDHVHFLGSMPPDQVRTHMEEAGIYLFTSDRQEGWGAVLNECMNSGCAVVASHATGSAPYMINNGENGLIYRSENVEDLFQKVKGLLDRPEEQGRLGRAAYVTVRDTWNAETAAERLLCLAERMLAGEKYPSLYDCGPCSRAGKKQKRG